MPLHKRFLLLIAVLLSFPLKAQYNSLLWEVSGNGLSKPSYLFGTIHLTDGRVFHFGDSVMICFNATQCMVGELVLDNFSKKGLLQTLFMPGDTTLKMLLRQKDYKFVKKYIRKNYGLMYSSIINRIKPIYTSVLLSEKPNSKDTSSDNETFFLDQYLQELAKTKNMELLGLETPTEQMKALEIMPLKQQAEYLVESVRAGNDKNEALLEKMIQAYIHQNLDSLYQFFVEQDLPEEMMRSLIVKRNTVMIERMIPMMKAKPSFIAVGAAHLPGQSGLIELLRRQGFTVRSVFCKKN